MEGNKFLPVLVALTVIMLVWGAAQAIHVMLRGEKRKLKTRLGHEAGVDVRSSSQERSITMQVEATGLSGCLARMAIFHGMYRRLVQAYPDMPFARFLGIVGAAALAGFAVPASLGRMGIGVLIGVVGGYLPVFLVNQKRNLRQKRIGLQLPEALDFLSRVLRAGHSLSTGLQMMGEELPPPLCGEFKRCYAQHSLGQSLDDALKDTARHVDSTDFAFFVTAVLIQRQTGGDLSEVLNNISSMIRQRIRLQQHVKAKTAEGRLTGYILVAFPAIMFFISYALNPAHAGKLLHDRLGIGLLILAFSLQMLGLYAIRKITTVKV